MLYQHDSIVCRHWRTVDLVKGVTNMCYLFHTPVQFNKLAYGLAAGAGGAADSCNWLS